MDKLNSFLQKALTFFDKNATLVIVLAGGFLVYKKFGNLFAQANDNKAAAEQALAAHDVLLAPSSAKKQPLPADKKAAPAVARQNVKVADLHAQAVAAEELFKFTKFSLSLPSTRREGAMKVAQSMKKYQLSLSGVATQYKAVAGRVLQEDMRVLFGSDYSKWLAIAGTVN